MRLRAVADALAYGAKCRFHSSWEPGRGAAVPWSFYERAGIPYDESGGEGLGCKNQPKLSVWLPQVDAPKMLSAEPELPPLMCRVGSEAPQPRARYFFASRRRRGSEAMSERESGFGRYAWAPRTSPFNTLQEEVSAEHSTTGSPS